MSVIRLLDFCPDGFARTGVTVGDAPCNLLGHADETFPTCEFGRFEFGGTGLTIGRADESAAVFGGAEDHVSYFAGDTEYLGAETYFCHSCNELKIDN